MTENEILSSPLKAAGGSLIKQEERTGPRVTTESDSCSEVAGGSNAEYTFCTHSRPGYFHFGQTIINPQLLLVNWSRDIHSIISNVRVLYLIPIGKLVSCLRRLVLV